MSTPIIDTAGAVRPGEELDLPALDAWLRQQLPDLQGQPEITQYSGGASNWTYRVAYANEDLILRRHRQAPRPSRPMTWAASTACRRR